MDDSIKDLMDRYLSEPQEKPDKAPAGAKTEPLPQTVEELIRRKQESK